MIKTGLERTSLFLFGGGQGKERLLGLVSTNPVPAIAQATAVWI